MSASPEQMADTLRAKLRDDGWRVHGIRGTQQLWIHPQNTRQVFVPVDNVPMDGRAVHTIYRLTGWLNPPELPRRDPGLRRTPFNPALSPKDAAPSDEKKLAAVLYAQEHGAARATLKYAVSAAELEAWRAEVDPAVKEDPMPHKPAPARTPASRAHVAVKDVTPQPPPPGAKSASVADAIAEAVVRGRYASDKDACLALGKSHSYTSYLKSRPSRIQNIDLRAEFVALMRRRADDLQNTADKVAQAVLSGRYAHQQDACRAYGKSTTYASYLRAQPHRIKDPELRRRFVDRIAQENAMPATPQTETKPQDPPAFMAPPAAEAPQEVAQLRAENERLRRALAEVTMDLYEARRP